MIESLKCTEWICWGETVKIVFPSSVWMHSSDKNQIKIKWRVIVDILSPIFRIFTVDQSTSKLPLSSNLSSKWKDFLFATSFYFLTFLFHCWQNNLLAGKGYSRQIEKRTTKKAFTQVMNHLYAFTTCFCEALYCSWHTCKPHTKISLHENCPHFPYLYYNFVRISILYKCQLQHLASKLCCKGYFPGWHSLF